MFESLRRKMPGASLSHLVFYEFACFVLRQVARLWRFRVHHPLRVPATGPLLLAANHQSYLDPPLIGIRLRQRHLNFVAKSGLFKSQIFASVIAWLNALPIREDAGDTAAIKETISRLERGGAVLIFPEGSRTDDGALAPFKRGVALLVKKAKCPVVPVAIEGAFDTWPAKSKMPRLFGCRVEVMYGEPIPHETLMKEGPDSALAMLAARIESMRMTLRQQMRARSNGRFPPPGKGDVPISAAPPPPSPPAAAATPRSAAPSADVTQTGS